ncbi:MAG: hypothetical protein ACK5LC_02705 [Coprobacillaceae bacterium]
MISNTLKLDYIIMMANNWEFDNNDVHIARGILVNYNEIPNYSLHTLIEKLHVSKQAFKKFYEQLGYHSYSEFKEDILFTKVVRKKQFMDRYRKLDLKHNIRIIEQFNNEKIDLNMIHSICEEIYNADKVIFYGSPTLVTKLLDFQLDMLIFGKTVITSSTNDKKVIKPNEKDIICICSSTGRIFKLCKTEMKRDVLHSNNKKILFCKTYTYNQDIDYVIETKTENDYFEMQYIYLFYLDLILVKYYERYIKKKR